MKLWEFAILLLIMAVIGIGLSLGFVWMIVKVVSVAW